MQEEEIKKTWRQLLIPFFIGLFILVTAILFHRFGSKRPLPQTIALFASVLGFIFTLIPGIKIMKFKKYLNNLK